MLKPSAVSTVSPSSTTWTLIVNVHARSGRRLLRAAVEHLGKAGIELSDVFAIRHPERLSTTARAAIERGSRRILVGGGDGTVSAVASALVGREIELGVLPLGTGNDFARSLDIPFDLPGAIAVLHEGRTVEVDVGLAGTMPFLNAAGLGLSAHIARGMRPTLKRLFGKLAYPLRAMQELPKFDGFDVTLKTPDTSLRVKALQVVVGNGHYHGAGNVVAPEATLADGLFDIYVIVPPGHEVPAGFRRTDASEWEKWIVLARVARKLREGTHVDDPCVLHLATPELTLEATPRQEINVDGELLGVTPMRFKVLPRALRVRAPNDTGQSLDSSRPTP